MATVPSTFSKGHLGLPDCQQMTHKKPRGSHSAFCSNAPHITHIPLTEYRHIPLTYSSPPPLLPPSQTADSSYAPPSPADSIEEVDTQRRAAFAVAPICPSIPAAVLILVAARWPKSENLPGWFQGGAGGRFGLPSPPSPPGFRFNPCSWKSSRPNLQTWKTGDTLRHKACGTDGQTSQDLGPEW